MIKVGIERINEYLDIFLNKRVGLITNPTGVDESLRSTIDILREKTELKALFSPEHGVRGNLQAGVKLDPYIDENTGCTVFSLYGDTRKPTFDMLNLIDVLCFDIQDVGARFYTYIYTLAYAMMAAKEHNKTVVVFDRPNPLGGIEVEGNILDLKFRSFVGYYEIPQRYGLTVGEIAVMFNEQFKIHCDLKVILMSGWKRSMDYEDTKRHWVLPSPNIPNAKDVYPYMATCIFEGTNVSEGRGTTKPFSIIGAPWFNSKKVIQRFNEQKLEGVILRELYFTPTFSKHKDSLCSGIELYVTNKKTFKPVITGMILLKIIESLHSEFAYIEPYKEGQKHMINLLVGDDFISKNLYSIEELKNKLKSDAKVFQSIKERYHLYEL
jgi:uncharacterized protein YbbC (DUF1343 family)